MKKLTENQKRLLPQVKENAPSNRKGKVLQRLIDGYLGGENLSKDDLDIIKIAVQLYQTKERQKKLHAKQRQQDYKERKAENKLLTREKIILGACEHWVIKNQKPVPFFSFLMAWYGGFLNERDREFMATRYQMKHGSFDTGFKFWRISDGKLHYVLREQYNTTKQTYQMVYTIIDPNQQSAVRSFAVHELDHDPRQQS